MSTMQRRRVLQLVASGVVGASWLRSDSGRVAGSQSGESTTADGFDPTVHGFGFANWEGDTGEGADGEEFTYEPSDVNREDVGQAIDDSWTSAFSEAQHSLMTRVVYSWIGGNAATNGHCYGMVFSADSYFQEPAELPADVDSASEIPYPTDEYTAAGDRIRRLQTSQLLRAEPYWFALLGMRWGLADHQESLALLMDAIDASGTSGLALDGEANPHQVLVHGYEQAGGVTEFFIYDPTYAAEDHSDPNTVWSLSVDSESGDVVDMLDGYDEFLFLDDEMDLSVVDRLIGGRDQVLEELSNAVFLGLETGGNLEIDVPDDVLVDRPDAEYADSERAPYSDAVLVIRPPNEFGISIDGEAGGEYALDALGLRDGDLALEKVVSDTLGEGPAQFLLTIDEAGALVLEAVEERAESAAEEAETAAEEAESAAEGAGEGAGEAADEAGDTAGESAQEAGEQAQTVAEETDTGTNWVEDNWLLAAAVSALGLGLGAAYRLIGRGDDES